MPERKDVKNCYGSQEWELKGMWLYWVTRENKCLMDFTTFFDTDILLIASIYGYVGELKGMVFTSVRKMTEFLDKSSKTVDFLPVILN